MANAPCVSLPDTFTVTFPLVRLALAATAKNAVCAESFARCADGVACAPSGAAAMGRHAARTALNRELQLRFIVSLKNRGPPNGPRLSCGRPARRRKGSGRQSVPARAQHSASLKAITARQLQALVRRRPRGQIA